MGDKNNHQKHKFSFLWMIGQFKNKKKRKKLFFLIFYNGWIEKERKRYKKILNK